MTDLKQQVAQDLTDSWLFGWASDKLAKPPYSQKRPVGAYSLGAIAKWMRDGHNGEFTVFGPWPTADQAEAVLGEMGLQVVWKYYKNLGKRTVTLELINGGDFVCDFDGLPAAGQRTLVNNAALAWLANQPDWKPKIKAALERLGLV